MTFLGILLIIAGIVVCISGAVLVGLIILALGGVCCGISSSNKDKEKEAKKQKEEAQRKQNIEESKETWVLTRTKEYIDNGMNPSDAKVKAEVDYLTKSKDEKVNEISKPELDENGMWTCPKCGTKNYDNSVVCKHCLSDR